MRRTQMKRGPGLKRKSWLKQRGDKSTELHALAFAEQADLCRHLPCSVPGCLDAPSDPHHDPTRGAGGKDGDTCPLCRRHHQLWHEKGREWFARERGVCTLQAVEATRARLAGTG